MQMSKLLDVFPYVLNYMSYEEQEVSECYGVEIPKQGRDEQGQEVWGEKVYCSETKEARECWK